MKLINVLIFVFFILLGCQSITSRTVLDVDRSKAILICSSDANLRIDEKSCFGEKNTQLIVENTGKIDIEGMTIIIDNDSIELNEKISVGQILAKDIGPIAHGNITLIPRVIINNKIFDCNNNQISAELRTC